MGESEYLDEVVIDLTQYAESHPDRLLESLQESSQYVVKEHDVDTIGPSTEDSTVYVVQNSAVSEKGVEHLVIGFLNCERPEFALQVNHPGDKAEEVECLQEILGETEFDSSVEFSYYYSRLLDVDEGNVKAFVDELISELESLGYAVTTERSAGAWVTEGEADAIKEYKWWFYIKEDDDEETWCPHGLDLYFTEDGIYIAGHVTEGCENADEFRTLLTEFES